MSDSSENATYECEETGDKMSSDGESKQLAGKENSSKVRNPDSGDKQNESEQSAQDKEEMSKCVGLEDFYIELDKLESLLFREELEIVLQSNPQAVNGTFTISVSEVEGRGDAPPLSLLIHISGKAIMDDTLECSTSITSCITTQLLTIDENRFEHTQLDIGDKCQQMYLGCEGNLYYCVTQVQVNNQVLNRNTKEIPIVQAKDLISEGANVILLRQMAIKGFVGELQINTILADGSICPSKYTCEGNSIINRDGEELTVHVIKRVVEESCNEVQTLVSTLTCAGQLIEHEWVGGLCLVRVPPYKKVTNVTKGFIDKPIPLEYEWERDMELTSCCLDNKSCQVASHKCYFADKPEMKALISDFVQAVLLLKPEDAIQFAVDYFSTFMPDTDEVESTKGEDVNMVSGIMSEMMDMVMKNITEKEMVDLIEQLVKAALRRAEGKDLIDSLQTMIHSVGKLSEILNILLNFFLEEADEGVVSGFLAIILRSAVKFEGETEVLEVLSRAVSTDEERELVSTIVRSASLLDSEHVVASLLEKLLMFTTDTVQNEKSRQIADSIVSELIERAIVDEEE